MQRSDHHDLQYLDLPTVCALVYWNVTGGIVDPSHHAQMQSRLNGVARVLARLLPIYAMSDGSSPPRRLSPFDLSDEGFSRGAHVFVTRRGMEIRGLSVQRCDISIAVETLRSLPLDDFGRFFPS